MWNNVGILRDETGLLDAQSELESLANNFKRNRKCLNQDEYEYRNMLTASLIVVESALSRRESRGAHSRSDYKLTSEIGVHSSVVKIYNKELEYAK